MSGLKKIVTGEVLNDYFEQIVHEAINKIAAHPRKETEAYLVDLLSHYAVLPPNTHEPISLILTAAQSETPNARIQKLKKAGDLSLYVAGYFGPSLEKSPLDLDYYRTMGGTAYLRLSRLVVQQGQAPVLSTVYKELSNKFNTFAKILSNVRFQTDINNEDVLDLYEKWIVDGESEIKNHLIIKGVAFDPRQKGKN